uniref:ANK_REP_REGION domain-containing protein n=1 Tax=Heterorhabditis bacteriophora TaxID=37862 RepID=A0A1I7XT45_HETBA
MTSNLESFPLHKAAFFNDTRSISQLIKSGRSLYEQDMHGNTALHISTMLGHREATALLLAHNAPVKVKNSDGWNPLMEAVSYGDRQIITEMLRKMKSQSRYGMSRKPHLVKMLEDLGDFYLELKWDFQSWIPLLSRMLPSDVCQIYKKGTRLRMDTTLADFSERRWERGDISFVFNAAADSETDQLVIMDNKTKCYFHIYIYIYILLLASGAAVGDDEFKSLQYRKSLAPPGRMPTTWEEYSGAAPGLPPPLGRAQVQKQNEKNFTALVGMVHSVPNLAGNLIDGPVADEATTLRKPIQKVYLWPSLNDAERAILRDAFFQIGRRTCVKFEEQEYKPWYHADRWVGDQPYVLIRKSKKYAAYSENTIEGLVDRTILYIAENAFQMDSFNNSRGAVMDQLVRFMGRFVQVLKIIMELCSVFIIIIIIIITIIMSLYLGMKREIYRPDSASYIQAIEPVPLVRQPTFHPTQLEWPFDPESITIPLWAREKYRLTQYCPARNNADIGAGQRVGLLTKWDTTKINSMYCPEMVKNADPHRGPCVVPRPKDVEEFRKRALVFYAFVRHEVLASTYPTDATGSLDFKSKSSVARQTLVNFQKLERREKLEKVE